MRSKFYVASDSDIRSGKTTDIYFKRTLEIIKARGADKRVKAEVMLKRFPDGLDWGVLAGVEEAMNLLEGLRINVKCMPEGTVFRAWEPVMVIEGMYSEFCVHETALLGLLCQASGVASRAARCKLAAKGKPVISFGARRMHPAISPMIDKNAYIGGCDGVSAVLSAELLGIEPMGTMPHALIILYGDTVEAARAFNEVIDRKVGRVVLIDTFNDERFEAVRVAQAIGRDLQAVRLDTPSSRRGDFKQLLREVRWELDIRGFKNVKILISGGLDESSIAEFCEVADAFGVGTSISNAPVMDFALDIVEVEGEPVSKRGKMSGAKQVLRCSACHSDRIVLHKELSSQASRTCSCGGEMHELLEDCIIEGKIIRPVAPPQETRDYVLSQLSWVG